MYLTSEELARVCTLANSFSQFIYIGEIDMTTAQFQNGRRITAAITQFIIGESDLTAEDILDDAQVLFNDDMISFTDYNHIVEVLSPYVGN